MKNEKIYDVTGVELAPGNMSICLGNGEHINEEGSLIECRCDECDYLMLCLENEDKSKQCKDPFQG